MRAMFLSLPPPFRKQFASFIKKNRYDLIVLDLQMPGMDGFEVMDCLKIIEPDGYLSVLVLSAQPEHKLRALQSGAKDFVSKPFQLPELLVRIHNLLEVRLLHRDSTHYNHLLERRVCMLREAESELRDAEQVRLKEKAVLDNYVAQLRQANEQLVVATVEAHALAEETETARAEMAHLAQHDALTNLPNRILFDDRLSQAMALAQRQGRQLALMFLDIDRFKHINDTLGHAVGDQVLQSVAQRLTASVRSSDTVCRQGGDEFVILLADVLQARDVALSAQNILAALALPHLLGQLELAITASLGISLFPDHGRDADTLIKNADRAMYDAKKNGRNQFRFFEPDTAEMSVSHSIEEDLRGALARNEFVLHFQPRVHLESGAISGVEALIRWQHPDRGLIMPEQFLWLAERCGLIVPIGTWALQQACRHAKAWQDAGLSPVSVAVNVSTLQFRHNEFFESVRGILADTDLAPYCLELELTEEMLMQDTQATSALLGALKRLGVLLVIDDFGTGYSNLSHLKRFQIDALKIDQSFMRDIEHAIPGQDDTGIVAAIVSMGKNLDQRVIAEGVETREQLAYLQKQGCTHGQGYYFCPPVTDEELVKLLNDGLPPTALNAGSDSGSGIVVG